MNHPRLFVFLCALTFPSIILSIGAYGLERPPNHPGCATKISCTNPSSEKPRQLLAPLVLVQATPVYGSDIGKWHLVRTPGPQQSGEVVSIMHTGDLLQSDPDFAGLVIRCWKKSALQIGFIVVQPFPPRAHPQVSISAGNSNVHLKGSVIPPGSMVSLPDEAEVLAKGPWQSANQLVVEIEGDGMKIRGIVPLENLAKAIAFLQANCPEH